MLSILSPDHVLEHGLVLGTSECGCQASPATDGVGGGGSLGSTQDCSGPGAQVVPRCAHRGEGHQLRRHD